MAKQDVNIGAEGNDGTGDSIRESFRKVNENFTDLYALVGAGGAVSFTLFSDTPSKQDLDDVVSTSASPVILGISESTGSSDDNRVVFYPLVSNGERSGQASDDTVRFEIYTDPNTQKSSILVTAFTTVSRDLSPKLGSNLDLAGFVAANPAPFSEWALRVQELNSRPNSQGNISVDDVLISKKVADQLYEPISGGFNPNAQVGISAFVYNSLERLSDVEVKKADFANKFGKDNLIVATGYRKVFVKSQGPGSFAAGDIITGRQTQSAARIIEVRQFTRPDGSLFLDVTYEPLELTRLTISTQFNASSGNILEQRSGTEIVASGRILWPPGSSSCAPGSVVKATATQVIVHSVSGTFSSTQGPLWLTTDTNPVNTNRTVTSVTALSVVDFNNERIDKADCTSREMSSGSDDVDPVTTLEFANARATTKNADGIASSNTRSDIVATVTRSLDEVTVNFQIEDDSIINTDVNANADILQSKLKMSLAQIHSNSDSFNDSSIEGQRTRQNLQGLAAFDASTFAEDQFWTLSAPISASAGDILQQTQGAVTYISYVVRDVTNQSTVRVRTSDQFQLNTPQIQKRILNAEKSYNAPQNLDVNITEVLKTGYINIKDRSIRVEHLQEIPNNTALGRTLKESDGQAENVEFKNIVRQGRGLHRDDFKNTNNTQLNGIVITTKGPVNANNGVTISQDGNSSATGTLQGQVTDRTSLVLHTSSGFFNTSGQLTADGVSLGPNSVPVAVTPMINNSLIGSALIRIDDDVFGTTPISINGDPNSLVRTLHSGSSLQGFGGSTTDLAGWINVKGLAVDTHPVADIKFDSTEVALQLHAPTGQVSQIISNQKQIFNALSIERLRIDDCDARFSVNIIGSGRLNAGSILSSQAPGTGTANTVDIRTIVASATSSSSGERSAVIASISSQASGSQSVVAASASGTSSGDQSAVIASISSRASGSQSVVAASQGVLNDQANSLALGFVSYPSEPNLVNRTIHLFGDPGDIFTKGQLVVGAFGWTTTTPTLGFRIVANGDGLALKENKDNSLGIFIRTDTVLSKKGFVGIGTEAPDQRLSVKGNIQVFGNNASQSVVINTATLAGNRTYTLPDTSTSTADFVMTEGNQIINGAKTFTGVTEFAQILQGQYVRDYAFGYSHTHTPIDPYQIGSITFTGDSRNISVIGEIRGATGASVGVCRFILNLRSNTLPNKSFSLFEEEITNLGRLIKVRVFQNQNSGLVVIGYSCTESIQSIGWSLRIQERGDYNYFQQVSDPTVMITTGLIEVGLTPTERSMSGSLTIAGKTSVGGSTQHKVILSGVGVTPPENSFAVTINPPAGLTGNRTYTLPNISAITGVDTAEFVMTKGDQIITGAKTFQGSNPIKVQQNEGTDAIVLNGFNIGTDSNSIIISTPPAGLTGDRYYTLPDTSTSTAEFVMTQGNQGISGTKSFTGQITFTGSGIRDAIDLQNKNIVGVNNIKISDPGANEGIEWVGGNLWKIYESPNNLTDNTSGNLQIVQGTTRRATFNTNGQLEIPVAIGTAPLVVNSTTTVANLSVETATKVVNSTTTATGTVELVRGNMAVNDQARILVGGTGENQGFLEIATADDGTEPIYVRQYTGVFHAIKRTATLLDTFGNTSFPGTVTIGGETQHKVILSGVGVTPPGNSFAVTINPPAGLTSNRTYTLPDVADSNFVMTQGDQDITGVKTFNNGISLGGNVTFSSAAPRIIAITESPEGSHGRSLFVSAGNSGTGTNRFGGNLVLSSGLGTGSFPGSILFRTSEPASISTERQTLSTKMAIFGNGRVGIGTENPLSKLDITSNDLGATDDNDLNGLALVNLTPATADSAQQISPAILWRGQGLRIDPTNASQQVQFRSYVLPFQGTSAPTGNLVFQSKIGNNSWSNAFVISDTGSVNAAGDVNTSSDERLKTNWRSVDPDFIKRMLGVKHGIFDRTDMQLTQVGVSAQDWQKVLPQSIKEDSNGMLSINYGSSALVAVIELAKEVSAIKDTLSNTNRVTANIHDGDLAENNDLANDFYKQAYTELVESFRKQQEQICILQQEIQRLKSM